MAYLSESELRALHRNHCKCNGWAWTPEAIKHGVRADFNGTAHHPNCSAARQPDGLTLRPRWPIYPGDADGGTKGP